MRCMCTEPEKFALATDRYQKAGNRNVGCLQGGGDSDAEPKPAGLVKVILSLNDSWLPSAFLHWIYQTEPLSGDFHARDAVTDRRTMTFQETGGKGTLSVDVLSILTNSIGLVTCWRV